MYFVSLVPLLSITLLRYDRQKLADPKVFDFRKYTRVNFAFFQVNEAGDMWGTDTWADRTFSLLSA